MNVTEKTEHIAVMFTKCLQFQKIHVPVYLAGNTTIYCGCKYTRHDMFQKSHRNILQKTTKYGTISSQSKKEVPKMIYFWAALTVVLVIVEAATVQLVTIWFAVGSLAAVIANLAGANTVWQCVIFVAVSLVVLVLTRPYVKRAIEKRAVPTNADRCIGREAIVSEQIDNRAGRGQVKIGGIEWTARSEDDSIIGPDEVVVVKKIEGVKVIVEKIKA